jgi:hypothetical protein
MRRLRRRKSRNFRKKKGRNKNEENRKCRKKARKKMKEKMCGSCRIERTECYIKNTVLHNTYTSFSG